MILAGLEASCLRNFTVLNEKVLPYMNNMKVSQSKKNPLQKMLFNSLFSLSCDAKFLNGTLEKFG